MNDYFAGKGDKKERKYQCFVCGRAYETFEEMKEHILERHEQGRDYIVCPVEWCLSPVRDIKSHFKTKHSSLPLPKVDLEKATVWRDFNSKKGKRVLKPKFRSGEFYSKKNEREFHYRSGLECELLEVLELIPSVKKYFVEPFKINYIFEGKNHSYTPDLSIIYDTNEIEVIEVKPSKETTLEINKAKWTTAEKFCKARGWLFTVITETTINKLKNKVKHNK